MRLRLLCASLLLVLTISCGNSGSPARFHPEARFLVEPLGGQQGTTFAVDYIASADGRHTLQPERVFTATEPFSFYLENAAPPYGAQFHWLGGAEADIVLIVSGRTIQISPVRLGPNNTTIELTNEAATDGSLATEPGRPDIRLEISADPGTFFEGTIGDFFTSYDIGFTIDNDERLQAQAPAIVFFENARETIGAVVRNANQLEITIKLYVNGDLIESDTSGKDAIVSRDL